MPDSSVYWQTAGIAAAISAVINVAGWLVNHGWALSRQKRSEKREKYYNCIENIKKYRDAAIEYWHFGAHDEPKHLLDRLYTLEDDYLSDLELIKEANPKASNISGFKLKKAATSGDTFASETRERCDETKYAVRRSAQDLIRLLEKQLPK